MAKMDRARPRISYLVKWVERALRAGLDAALSGHGVTTAEYTALSVLRHRDRLSSAQLARRAFVTPQAMNQIVIELERRGLIERRSDASHRRIQRISLTGKAIITLDACDEATAPIEEQLLSTSSRAEVESLRAALWRCAIAMGAGHGREGSSPPSPPGRAVIRAR
jgi:DNA-binding MarR family transcriptional regulator